MTDEQVLETPELSEINIDIEQIKKELGNQETTDITERITEDIVRAVKFDNAKVEELKQGTKQIYLIDLTDCELITEHWMKGLNNLVLCSSLSDFNYEESNKLRFSNGLTELIPDASLAIKIKTTEDIKTLFVGYIDMCQAYKILANYVSTLQGAKLYCERNGKLRLITNKDIHGYRVHL